MLVKKEFTQQEYALYKQSFASGECPVCRDNHKSGRCGAYLIDGDATKIKTYVCKTLQPVNDVFVQSGHNTVGTKYRFALGTPEAVIEAINTEAANALVGPLVFISGSDSSVTPGGVGGAKKLKRRVSGFQMEDLSGVNWYTVEDRDRLYRSIHAKMPKKNGSFTKNILGRLNVAGVEHYERLYIDPWAVMGNQMLLEPLTPEEIKFIDDTFPRPLRDCFAQKDVSRTAPYGLIPIFAPDGRIHGWQQMKDKLGQFAKDGGPKYLFASGNDVAINGKKTLHKLYVGGGRFEHPITTLVARQSCDTVYCMEGILKPHIFWANQAANVHVIGAIGGQLASSPVLLAQSLTHLKGLGVTRLVIMPDENWLSKHKGNVLSWMSNLQRFAEDFGLQVFLGEIGQVQGLVKDADEILEPVSKLGNHVRPTDTDLTTQAIINSVFPNPKVLGTVKPEGVEVGKVEVIAADDVQMCRELLLEHQGGVVIDKRPLGAGKSTTVADFAKNSGKRVVYVSASTQTVGSNAIYAEATPIFGRHKGLFKQPGRVNASGEPLVLTVPSNEPVAGPNCAMPDAFGHAHNADIGGYELCQKCPHFADCKSGTSEHGFDYLHKRELALESQFISCTVAAVPLAVCDENTYVFFDEASTLFTPRVRTYSRVAVRGAAKEFSDKNPNLGFKLTMGVDGLPVATWDQNYTKDQLIGALVGFDISRSHSAAYMLLRRGASHGFVKMAELVKTILGDIEGVMNVTSTEIVVETRATLVDALRDKGSTVVLLDATSDTHILCAKVGVDVTAVTEFVGHDNSPLNCRIKVWHTSGFNRVDNKTVRQTRLPIYRQRLKEMEPETGFLMHKAYAEAGDGIYFSSSRGSNAFENMRQLVLVGLPIPSLEVLAREYEVLKAALPYTFEQFCDLSVQAETKQAIGRLRAHRRSGLDLVVSVIGNYDLEFLKAEGWTITNHLAEDLLTAEECQAVATSPELKSISMVKRITQAVRDSGADTVSKVAETLGRRVDSIQRTLTRLGLCLSALHDVVAAKPKFGNWAEAPEALLVDGFMCLENLKLTDLCQVIKDCAKGVWYRGWKRTPMLSLYDAVRQHALAALESWKEQGFSYVRDIVDGGDGVWSFEEFADVKERVLGLVRVTPMLFASGILDVVRAQKIFADDLDSSAVTV